MAVPGDSTVRWFHSGMSGLSGLTNDPGTLIELIDACLIDGFDVRTINNLAVEDEVAVAEISSGHSYEKHAVIRISGASPAALNGDWRIIAATGSTLTFNAPGVSDTTATGEITAKRATPGYWEKAFSDGDRAAYRSTHPDATGYYLFIDDTGSDDLRWARVRGYQSMNNIDSGGSPFPTHEQEGAASFRFVKTRPQVGNSGPRPFAIVCDARFVYFIISVTNDDFSTSWLFYFGDVASYSDIDESACVIAGAASSSSAPGLVTDETDTYDFSGSSDGMYWAVPAQGGTEPLSLGQYGIGPESEANRNNADIAEQFGQFVFHHPIHAAEPGGFLRGYLPGLYQGLQPRSLLLGGYGFEVLEPAPAFEKALFVTAGRSSIRYYTFDIWGPWR